MISKSKLLLLILIIFCASVFAQDIQSFEINGLKIILKQNTSNDIISANMFFKGGVSVLTEDQAGIENLTLVVAQKATKNYPKEQLNAELESMNSQINSNSNQDYSSLNLLCVKQNFEKSWNIFSDIILNPLFSEDDLNLERDKIIANVKQVNDNPDAYLQKIANEEFYIDHPYSVSVNGTETTLSSFTKKDVSDFYSQRLKTSNMLLVVVGNVTKYKAKKAIEEVLDADSRILKDPAPMIVVSELGDSSVNFNVRPWVNSTDYWAVYFETTEKIKKKFDEQNISIPFPQRDVHMHQN